MSTGCRPGAARRTSSTGSRRSVAGGSTLLVTDNDRAFTKTVRKQRRSLLIEEYESSGQAQSAFCAQRGVALSTFSYWRRKLKAQEADSEPTFVELRSGPVESAPARASASAAVKSLTASCQRSVRLKARPRL